MSVWYVINDGSQATAEAGEMYALLDNSSFQSSIRSRLGFDKFLESLSS